MGVLDELRRGGRTVGVDQPRRGAAHPDPHPAGGARRPARLPARRLIPPRRLRLWGSRGPAGACGPPGGAVVPRRPTPGLAGPGRGRAPRGSRRSGSVPPQVARPPVSTSGCDCCSSRVSKAETWGLSRASSLADQADSRSTRSSCRSSSAIRFSGCSSSRRCVSWCSSARKGSTCWATRQVTASLVRALSLRRSVIPLLVSFGTPSAGSRGAANRRLSSTGSPGRRQPSGASARTPVRSGARGPTMQSSPDAWAQRVWVGSSTKE